MRNIKACKSILANPQNKIKNNENEHNMSPLY